MRHCVGFFADPVTYSMLNNVRVFTDIRLTKILSSPL